jgi:SAM-dependent methyltransferase
MADQATTPWASGSAYEAYVGRWSRLVARRFLDWLHAPAGVSWLDVGCGTGELTLAILETQSPSSVVGIDPSERFIAYARERVRDERAKFDVGDAMELPYDEEWFEAAVSGLVLNFLPDPARAVRGMCYVVTCLDGPVGAYVWDYAGKMEMIRYFWDAAVAIDPAAAEMDEGNRFSVCGEATLEALFRSEGLSNVETKPIDVLTTFSDFDDYWTPFLGGQGPAPAYAMSLSEDRRAALRERLRASLPVASDGSIELLARAWAVKGTT